MRPASLGFEFTLSKWSGLSAPGGPSTARPVRHDAATALSTDRSSGVPVPTTGAATEYTAWADGCRFGWELSHLTEPSRRSAAIPTKLRWDDVVAAECKV